MFHVHVDLDLGFGFFINFVFCKFMFDEIGLGFA